MKRPDIQDFLPPFFPRTHPADIRRKIAYVFPIYSYLFPRRKYESLRPRVFDQDRAFDAWVLAGAMEEYRSRPPQVNMDISESLGRLSALPRELRDEIYSYVLPRGHTGFWRENQESGLLPIGIFRNNGFQPLKNPGSNLALLRLSKHIHEEATPLLYSQNKFMFFPPSTVSRRPAKLPRAAIADCITTVEFHLILESDYLQWALKTEEAREYGARVLFGALLPGSVALFTGRHVRRRSALIEIDSRQWFPYTTHIIPSQLFTAFGQLTGFQKVTVRIYVCSVHYCPWKSMSDDEIDYWREREDGKTVFFAEMEPLLEAFRVKLEVTNEEGVSGE
ncbi:hypothetical protein BDR22DRAFT_371178 [Usnea florida]